MLDIENTEQTEAAALPSLFQIADDIDEIEREANQLVRLLYITATYVHNEDVDIGNALFGLYTTLNERVSRLDAIGSHVMAHSRLEGVCE